MTIELIVTLVSILVVALWGFTVLRAYRDSYCDVDWVAVAWFTLVGFMATMLWDALILSIGASHG